MYNGVEKLDILHFQIYISITIYRRMGHITRAFLKIWKYAGVYPGKAMSLKAKAKAKNFGFKAQPKTGTVICRAKWSYWCPPMTTCHFWVHDTHISGYSNSGSLSSAENFQKTIEENNISQQSLGF